jgi:hypothetical protein
MAAAERARARSQRAVLWRLRKPKTHMNVTAMTSAHMLHAEEFRDWPHQCQRARLQFSRSPTPTISAKGFGDADPVASNDTPHDSAQNRRVEQSVPASGRRDFCFAL